MIEKITATIWFWS